MPTDLSEDEQKVRENEDPKYDIDQVSSLLFEITGLDPPNFGVRVKNAFTTASHIRSIAGVMFFSRNKKNRESRSA